jgi:hypothetical protein
MNSKIFMPALIATVLTAAAVIAATTGTHQQKPKNEPEKAVAAETLDIDGSIKAYAQQAKAKGLQRIVIPAPSFSHDGEAAGFDEATSDHSVVVAQAIEKRSLLITPNLISTWYKFRITDTLSKKKIAPLKCKDCSLPTPPPEMLPLNRDEILVPKVGGTVIVDGVEVTMVDANSPEYTMAQDYVLLLADRNAEVANVRAGALGAFTVKADGTLEPIDKKSNPIQADLKKRFNNSLHDLKQHLKAKAAPEK